MSELDELKVLHWVLRESKSENSTEQTKAIESKISELKNKIIKEISGDKNE